MIVLDCSAALEICRNTEKGRAFASLLVTGEKVIAPSLFIDELSNALWKYVSAGVYSTKAACDLLGEALDLVDEFHSDRALAKEVLAESVHARHPSYDFFYLVLAKREGATLYSSDKRLNQLAGEMGVDHISQIAL